MIVIYKGRYEVNNKFWYVFFDISKVFYIVFWDNVVVGSERIGFYIWGEGCYGDNFEECWEVNFVYIILYGIYIGFYDGLFDCFKIVNFIFWKSWDFGVFGYLVFWVII